MSFSIDPGSAFDLKKVYQLAESMMEDYPDDTRLRTIRTIVRRISNEAKIDITDEKPRQLGDGQHEVEPKTSG